DKRIDRAFLQLDELDQHGSRGVDGLRIEVANLRADFAAHERAHEREVAERRTARRWGLGLGITAAVALVGPVYPLLLLLLERPRDPLFCEFRAPPPRSLQARAGTLFGRAGTLSGRRRPDRGGTVRKPDYLEVGKCWSNTR